jgi:hypothetical protein
MAPAIKKTVRMSIRLLEEQHREIMRLAEDKRISALAIREAVDAYLESAPPQAASQGKRRSGRNANGR